jgi:hypothetical protein
VRSRGVSASASTSDTAGGIKLEALKEIMSKGLR